MSDKGKKRKKQYYKQAAKRGKWSNALDAGMRGFFITCNNREREAVREAYNLFNEYADKLYGEEQVRLMLRGFSHQLIAFAIAVLTSLFLRCLPSRSVNSSIESPVGSEQLYLR